jgi:hypothetical protein
MKFGIMPDVFEELIGDHEVRQILAAIEGSPGLAEGAGDVVRAGRNWAGELMREAREHARW